MDKNEHDHVDEERVEDLDPSEAEAEDVKGGFSWGANQTASFKQGFKQGFKQDIQGLKQTGGLDGLQSNHNETLVTL